MVSEMRAFEIQNIDYQDRFILLDTLNNSDKMDIKSKPIIEFTEAFKNLTTFPSKLKYVCEFIKKNKELKDSILEYVPNYIKNYYTTLGYDICKKTLYRKSLLDKEIKKIQENQEINVIDLISKVISPGNKYSKLFIKTTLQEIYKDCGYKKSPKATDLEEWFELKPCKINNKETGKRDMGFEIIKKKEL